MRRVAELCCTAVFFARWAESRQMSILCPAGGGKVVLLHSRAQARQTWAGFSSAQFLLGETPEKLSLTIFWRHRRQVKTSEERDKGNNNTRDYVSIVMNSHNRLGHVKQDNLGRNFGKTCSNT